MPSTDMTTKRPQNPASENPPIGTTSYRNVIVLLCGGSHEHAEFAKLFVNEHNPLHATHIRVLDIQKIGEPQSLTRGGRANYKCLGELAYSAGVGKQPYELISVLGKGRRWYQNAHNAGNDATTTLWAFVSMTTAHLDHDQPVPYPFHKDSLFVAVDMENGCQKPNDLLSCGIATLDTRDVSSVPPGRNGKGWLPHMKFRDICLKWAVGWVNEYGPLLCLGDGDFDYGETELCGGLDFIRDALKRHLTVEDRGTAMESTLRRPKPVQGLPKGDENNHTAEKSDQRSQENENDREGRNRQLQEQNAQNSQQSRRHGRKLRKKKWKMKKTVSKYRKDRKMAQKSRNHGVSGNKEGRRNK